MSKQFGQYLGAAAIIALVVVLIYFFYRLWTSESAVWLLGIAFSLTLMIETGWKNSLVSLTSVAIFCLIIYFIMMLLESKEYKEGIAAYENKAYQQAVTYLQQVVAQDKTHYNAYYYLCDSKLKLKQYKNALAYCNRAIDLDYPLKNESHAARGRVYEALGQTQKAIKDYSISLDHFQSWYVLYERCRMYIRSKQYDQAVADCEKSRQLNPQWQAILLPLGNAYYKNKNYDSALSIYLKYQLGVNEVPEYISDRIEQLSQK
jgi:tetratricopeptide (TPR) repeat protein